ncbi:hypothetical protein B484DRAFT_204752 [Ochromonadaceae sp. CCMP2298]|nr:hypothetical protein B484DRAFT_204752 [Ochromonadaceae sp. CCMP2298]
MATRAFVQLFDTLLRVNDILCRGRRAQKARIRYAAVTSTQLLGEQPFSDICVFPPSPTPHGEATRAPSSQRAPATLWAPHPACESPRLAIFQ